VGTVPVSWSTFWVRPADTEATPATLAVSVTAASGKAISVDDRKKSWVKLVPAGPSLERSVKTLEFRATSSWVAAL
jgi:hypothetical protein